ncbi:MAG: NAD(P)H-dependent glycerol-3-phosphate dehydrogenase [Desulfosudaceae bacterium]
MNKDVDQVNIAVVGAGSWGTALAHLLAGKGLSPLLWAWEPELCSQIEDEHENRIYLPGIKLAPGIRMTNDLAEAVTDRDIVLMVVPSHLMRQVAGQMAAHLAAGTIVATASKGIENKTHLTMTGVLEEALPTVDRDHLAVLSGPSFAREVAADISAPVFRVYTNNDVIGVELGGAMKNVIALASGIVDGLGLGLNTRAAMITRGLAEIRRAGIALGADPHTFSGLAGVGDLILTCTGNLSRNYTVGKKLGEGLTIDEILSEMRMVAEGVKTAKSVYNLSRKLGVEMPICNEVYAVIYEGVSAKDAVVRLMTRSLKNEIDEDVKNSY